MFVGVRLRLRYLKSSAAALAHWPSCWEVSPDGTDNLAVYEKRNTTLQGNRAMNTQHHQTASARRQCGLESLGRPLEKCRLRASASARATAFFAFSRLIDGP